MLFFFSFLYSTVSSSVQTYISSCLDSWWGSCMPLAPDWTFGFCPPPQLLTGLPKASSDEATPLLRSLLLHYFPENEIEKHMVQVIFIDICQNFLTHGLHASDTSLLFSFVALPPGSGMIYKQSLSAISISTMMLFLITQTLGTSLSFDPIKTLHCSHSTYSFFCGYLFVYTLPLPPLWGHSSLRLYLITVSIYLQLLVWWALNTFWFNEKNKTLIFRPTYESESLLDNRTSVYEKREKRNNNKKEKKRERQFIWKDWVRKVGNVRMCPTNQQN